jgi:hypothetical protein
MSLNDLGPMNEPSAAITRAAAEKASLRDVPARRRGPAGEVGQFGLGLAVRAARWLSWKLFGWVVLLPIVVIFWLALLSWFFATPYSFLGWYFSVVGFVYRAAIAAVWLVALALQVWFIYATYQFGLRIVDHTAPRLHPARATIVRRRKRRIAASLSLAAYAFATQIVFVIVPSLFSGEAEALASQVSKSSPEARWGMTIAMAMLFVVYWLPLLYQWSVVSAFGRPSQIATPQTEA